MPDDTHRIATERIQTLLQQAQRHPAHADRYMQLARRIASRTRTHLPREARSRICRSCKGYLPATARTRIRSTREPHVATTCPACGYVNRTPLKRRQP